jgi:hypothetical protein
MDLPSGMLPLAIRSTWPRLVTLGLIFFGRVTFSGYLAKMIVFALGAALEC